MADSSIILDAWGNPYPKPAPETLGERIVSRVTDRASLGSVLTSITPANIRGIFAQADTGMIGRQIELADDVVERNGHLRTQVMLRSLAVSSLRFEVKAGSDSEGSEKAAEDARTWWRALKGHRIVRRLMKAVYRQYAIEQVIWDTSDGKWTPIGTEEVDARRLCWPQAEQGTGNRGQGTGSGQQPTANSQQLSVITPGLQRMFGDVSNLEPIWPGKYIVSMCDVDRARPGKGAMVRVLAVLFMLKHYAVIDWAGLVEKFGMPWTIVKYVPGMSDEELIALIDKLSGSRAERLLAVPNTAAVETTTGTSHTSSPPQEAFISFIEETESKVVQGNTTQTDPAGGGAENVSSPQHGRGTLTIRDADAVDRGEDLSDGLFAPWFAWNRQAYPADAVAPVLVPVLQDDAAATLEFQRGVYKQYQADGTVADMLVNATMLKELTRAVQLPVNEEYEEPYVPVRDRTQALISGDVIKDSKGNIVGGKPVPGSAPVQPSPFGGFGMGRRDAENAEKVGEGIGNRDQGTGAGS